MTQDDIIKMAIEARLPHYWESGDEIVYIDRVTHFAKLVAQHVLTNADPKSFMSYQEGFDAGNRLAINGICKQLRMLHDSYALASNPGQLRQRGTK